MSRLYLVPSPLGNLKDITLRALDILKDVDIILAEDSRKTGNLLNHFNIRKTIRSYHQANEHKVLKKIIRDIHAGNTMALITDAGTPGISDPGFLIVRACIENNIEVECLPGPTAFVPALVISGLPADKFCFEGFLPFKKGRNKRLSLLAEDPRTTIFYESPHRLLKTLDQIKTFFGPDRRASVSRELTKIYEETIRGTIQEIHDHFLNNPVRGEFVIVVEGKKGS